VLGRRIVAERRVRTFFVVDVLEYAQALLAAHAGCGLPFGGVLNKVRCMRARDGHSAAACQLRSAPARHRP